MCMEKYLREKRQELIWALAKQEYTGAQIAKLFGTTRSTVAFIIKQMPADWQPKWKKDEK